MNKDTLTASFNGPRPFVLVDIADDNPTRGDTRGNIGLAERIAEKINAKLMIVSDETLEVPHRPVSQHRTALMQELFNRHGYPDIILQNRESHSTSTVAVAGKGRGVIVNEFNESLPGTLGVRWPEEIFVPSHLSAKTLQYQGDLFAHEFSEMPRPFIAVNMAGETSGLAAKLASLEKSYPEATFFICSCHRTRANEFNRLIKDLVKKLGSAASRFPIVNLDHRLDTENYGVDGVWNPYPGMIAQADHIIISGHSSSMVADVLAAGKSVYLTNFLLLGNTYSNEVERNGGKNLVKYIHDHKDGEPLQTEPIKTIDMTDICADRILKIHKQVATRGKRPFYALVRRKASLP